MMIGTVELESSIAPLFGLLVDIICEEEPSLLFVFQVMKTHGYDASLGAYVCSSLSEFKCVYRSSLKCYYLFNAIHLNSNTYIKSKYDLSVYCNYTF